MLHYMMMQCIQLLGQLCIRLPSQHKQLERVVMGGERMSYCYGCTQCIRKVADTGALQGVSDYINLACSLKSDWVTYNAYFPLASQR